MKKFIPFVFCFVFGWWFVVGGSDGGLRIYGPYSNKETCDAYGKVYANWADLRGKLEGAKFSPCFQWEGYARKNPNTYEKFVIEE